MASLALPGDNRKTRGGKIANDWPATYRISAAPIFSNGKRRRTGISDHGRCGRHRFDIRSDCENFARQQNQRCQ
jgi:hypothetical protein